MTNGRWLALKHWPSYALVLPAKCPVRWPKVFFCFVFGYSGSARDQTQGLTHARSGKRCTSKLDPQPQLFLSELNLFT
jgi:hypothetical protein